MDEKVMQFANGNANYLKAGIEHFEAAMYVYVVGILLSLCVKLAVICMPEDFVLTDNNVVNEGLAIAIMFGYLTYAVRTIYKIKSVVANTAALLGGSLAFKIQTFASKRKEEN